MIKSKALEINLADYHVDVTIEEKYSILQEIMSQYYGLMEGLNNFLRELSHPYRNWHFIVTEARGYGLEYFHLLVNHPKGPAAADLFVDIFIDAIESTKDTPIQAEAVDNLLLFLQKILKDSGTALPHFMPVVNNCFDRIRHYDGNVFFLFVKSYYQIKRLAEILLKLDPEFNLNYQSTNLLLLKYFHQTYSYWLRESDPQTWFEEESGEFSPEGTRQDLSSVFSEISHARIEEFNSQVNVIDASENIESEAVLKKTYRTSRL